MMQLSAHQHAAGRTAREGPRLQRSNRPCRRRMAVRAAVEAPAAPVTTVPALQALPPPISSASQLPPSLRNAVATLSVPNPRTPGGATTVWLLGVSHVSKVSCDQISELIAAVQPQVVMVELCKDRLGLLVDEEQQGRIPDVWHCRRILFDGLPGSSDEEEKKKEEEKKEEGEKKEEDAASSSGLDPSLWPTEAQLRSLLIGRPGRPMATADIEADLRTLLATGLFGRGRPSAGAATRIEAPTWGLEIDAAAEWQEGAGAGEPRRLAFIPPLGNIRFVLEPRTLPAPKALRVRVDSSLAGRVGSELQARLDGVAAEALAKAAGGAPGLEVYLWARQQLLEVCGGEGAARVAFSGVESGAEVEALLRAPYASDPAYVSGLEGSALGGEGAFIDAFRPQRTTVQLTPRMQLPSEAMAAVSARRARGALGGLAPIDSTRLDPPRTEFSTWSEEEMDAAADAPSPLPPGDFVTEALAQLLTSPYSKLQSRAGRTAGISPGAAWRAALSAAVAVGSQQVVLGDRPASVSERRLAGGVAAAAAGRAAAAAGMVAAGFAAAAAPQLDTLLAGSVSGDAVAVGAGLLGGAALLWPVVGPFVEAWRFSRLGSAAEVEAAVAITSPITDDLDKPLLLWGEDALLRWPNAMERLIHERDAYMARVVAAAAAGTPCGAPALVATEVEGRALMRYMMPPGGAPAAAPHGMGDGEYGPLPVPGAVVAVVGSAHVRGMCRGWEDAVAAVAQHGGAQLDEMLKVEE